MYNNMKSLFTVVWLLAVIYKTQGHILTGKYFCLDSSGMTESANGDCSLDISANDRLLECWHCSSDTVGAESFCDTDFSEKSIPTDLLKEHKISIVRSCNSTINSEHERPVCRKTIEEVNGQTITKRFCYYTNKSDPLDHCQEEATDKNVKRVFCQDCLTDKCNAASQMFGMSFLLIFPFSIVKNAIL